MRSAFLTAAKVLLVIVALPIAAIAGLVASAERREADEVAAYLRNFVDGGGGEWDWDDFTSVPIADPQLEDIRRRAAAVDLPPSADGVAILRELLREAELVAMEQTT
jgi:hypothetical protein